MWTECLLPQKQATKKTRELTTQGGAWRARNRASPLKVDIRARLAQVPFLQGALLQGALVHFVSASIAIPG